MQAIKKIPIFAIGVLFFSLFSYSPAEAQLSYTGPSSHISPGRRLSSDAVKEEIERRLARSPANEATIWNTAYDFFRLYPQNQDTAKAIKEGFLKARANNPEQKKVLLKAAIYWEKVHDYGIKNVPVGQNRASSQRIYFGDSRKQSTLPRRSSGSKHQGFTDYDWPGRHINKGKAEGGRPHNPYPGKYYPGMYPP